MSRKLVKRRLNEAQLFQETPVKTLLQSSTGICKGPQRQTSTILEERALDPRKQDKWDGSRWKNNCKLSTRSSL